MTFQLFITKTKKAKIDDLKGNKVGISIPYAASKNEEAERLRAVYVDENGNIEWLETSVL